MGPPVQAQQPTQNTLSTMDLNNNNIDDSTELRARSNWNEIKGQAKQKWGQLTDDDMTYEEGRQDEWFGRLQERTGETIDDIKNWFRRTF
jgi:uncharacterized protein YjbJ (UPF0337 family)